MTASVLIAGRLWKAPEQKTAKPGAPFIAAPLREGSGENVTWWRILCFAEGAMAGLVRLRERVALAASGAFKAETYERRGETRVGLTVIADRAISARPIPKTDGAGSPGAFASSGKPIDDDIPI